MKRVGTDGRARLLVALLLLGCVACDGGSVQRTSQFERLTGTWTASSLRVDGFDFTSPLNATYDRLEITFTATGEGLGSYELRGTKDGTNTLAVRGPVQIVNDDALVLEGGFARRVFWTFEFETSRRLTLRSPADRNAGTTGFLQRVLPGQTWGEMPDVAFRLQADEDA